MKALAVALAVGVATCAGPGYGTRPAPLPERWPAQLRPVSVVVDRTMPVPCMLALGEALDFWAARGIDWLHPTLGAPQGLITPGQIEVISGPMGPSHAGETASTSLKGTQLRVWAEVNLGDCRDIDVAIHEVGHALGLVHHPDPRNVMYFMALPGEQRDVTLEQLAEIR